MPGGKVRAGDDHGPTQWNQRVDLLWKQRLKSAVEKAHKNQVLRERRKEPHANLGAAEGALRKLWINQRRDDHRQSAHYQQTAPVRPPFADAESASPGRRERQQKAEGQFERETKVV